MQCFLLAPDTARAPARSVRAARSGLRGPSSLGAMVFLRNEKPYAGSDTFALSDVPKEMTLFEWARGPAMALGVGVPVGWYASGKNKLIRAPCVGMAMTITGCAGLFMGIEHAAKRLHGTMPPLPK